jgi:hypothetical protein
MAPELTFDVLDRNHPDHFFMIKAGQGILREHLASVRSQKGLEDLASIPLRWLDFSPLNGRYSPAIEGLVFCRAGAKLVKFRSQISNHLQKRHEIRSFFPMASPAYPVVSHCSKHCG